MAGGRINRRNPKFFFQDLRGAVNTRAAAYSHLLDALSQLGEVFGDGSLARSGSAGGQNVQGNTFGEMKLEFFKASWSGGTCGKPGSAIGNANAPKGIALHGQARRLWTALEQIEATTVHSPPTIQQSPIPPRPGPNGRFQRRRRASWNHRRTRGPQWKE